MPCNDCSRTDTCPPCPHEGTEENDMDKPVYSYWVNPRKEGDTEVQMIAVYGPDGRRIGLTQMWRGVDAEEMVKDFVEVTTDLVWPEFKVELLEAQEPAEKVLRRLQKYLESKPYMYSASETEQIMRAAKGDLEETE